MTAQDSHFDEWWSRVEGRIVALGRKLLRSDEAAMDLAQDIVEGALRRFRDHPSYFADEGHLAAWCLTRARWLAIDRLRLDAHQVTLENFPDVKSHDRTPQQLALDREVAETIGLAVDHLPPKQRIVVLKTMQGKSAKQIAAMLGISPATVRSLYRHARFRLATELWQDL